MTGDGPRSVKIDQDERTGWSSDRPRKEGGRPREVDVSVRCQVLAPSDRLRYSPGSILMIAATSAADRDAFAERLIDDKGALLSLDKVRALLAGRVDEDQVEEKARQLLDAAIAKRLESGDSVVVPLESLDAATRGRYVRMAFAHRRPRHLILIEGKDELSEDQQADLTDLRRSLMAGDLGAEGYNTALRLTGPLAMEVKKILFRPPPRDDD